MSKTIPLTKGQYAIVDDEDYERVISAGKWWAMWNRDTQSFYAYRTFRENGHRQNIGMHIFILGEKRGIIVDHVQSAETLDNRRCNLRYATHSQNSTNRRISRNNTSGFKGVSFHIRKEMWGAYLSVNGKRKNLGYYDNPVDAAIVRDKEHKKLYGEFAQSNF